MEKIRFELPDTNESVDLFVLEQTSIGGSNYILVTDKEEGDAEAFILKEEYVDDNNEATYDIIEDDEELESVASIFEELFDDIDFEI